MRFFSNDKDARDDQQGVDVRERAEEVNPDQAHDDHPERVQSDPVAVPQQRSGSPWSSTPDTADSPASGDALRPDDSEVRRDGDEPVPSDSTTTATSEAGSGSHRADLDQPVDLPLDDKDETVREDSTPPDHAVSDTAPDATVSGDSVSGDSVSGDSNTTYRPDGTVSTAEAGDTSEEPPDSALKDDGGFADPQAVDPATDEPLDTPTDRPLDAADTSSDETGSDETGSDETGSDHSRPDESTLNDQNADSAAVVPVVAAVPVAAAAAAGGTESPATDSKPGSVTAPDLGKLFAADEAQSFQDRWRDVQLRFVDSPKEATSDAARLVDEAVDQLTASLKSQKGALSGDNGEDTEKLRVELRGYRDILNRILAL